MFRTERTGVSDSRAASSSAQARLETAKTVAELISQLESTGTKGIRGTIKTAARALWKGDKTAMVCEGLRHFEEAGINLTEPGNRSLILSAVLPMFTSREGGTVTEKRDHIVSFLKEQVFRSASAQDLETALGLSGMLQIAASLIDKTEVAKGNITLMLGRFLVDGRRTPNLSGGASTLTPSQVAAFRLSPVRSDSTVRVGGKEYSLGSPDTYQEAKSAIHSILTQQLQKSSEFQQLLLQVFATIERPESGNESKMEKLGELLFWISQTVTDEAVLMDIKKLVGVIAAICCGNDPRHADFTCYKLGIGDPSKLDQMKEVRIALMFCYQPDELPKTFLEESSADFHENKAQKVVDAILNRLQSALEVSDSRAEFDLVLTLAKFSSVLNRAPESEDGVSQDYSRVASNINRGITNFMRRHQADTRPEYMQTLSMLRGLLAKGAPLASHQVAQEMERAVGAVSASSIDLAEFTIVPDFQSKPESALRTFYEQVLSVIDKPENKPFKFFRQLSEFCSLEETKVEKLDVFKIQIAALMTHPTIKFNEAGMAVLVKLEAHLEAYKKIQAEFSVELRNWMAASFEGKSLDLAVFSKIVTRYIPQMVDMAQQLDAMVPGGKFPEPTAGMEGDVNPLKTLGLRALLPPGDDRLSGLDAQIARQSATQFLGDFTLQVATRYPLGLNEFVGKFPDGAKPLMQSIHAMSQGTAATFNFFTA